MIIPPVQIPQSEIADLQKPFINDLLAYYKQLEEETMVLVDRAQDEGWTPEELMREIDLLIAGDNRAPATEVQKARRLDGKTEYRGLPISIENKAGSTREGVDPDGHPWSTTMIHPYGYIRGTEGTDGDHVDVFLGSNPEANIVYVVHIKNPETGEYDEDKCYLGFDSVDQVKESFRQHYDREDVFDSVEEIPFDRFVELLDKNKGKKIVNKSIELFRVQKSLIQAVKAKKINNDTL